MNLPGLLDQFTEYVGKNVSRRFLICLFGIPIGIFAFLILFIKSDLFSGLTSSVTGLCLFVVLLGIYFFPAIKAYQEKKANRQAILVLNIFLGWTFVGWVIALVWAYKKEDVARS